VSIFDKPLTSTTSTKKLEEYVREEKSVEEKLAIQNKIATASKAKVKFTEAETDAALQRAHYDNLSKETPIERRLIYRAPDAWNFFGKPDSESYMLMLSSIAQDGLMSPIILWEHENPENPEQKYMILSGHTRESAYDDLYQVTGDDKYLAIAAKIYKADDIDENDAQRIIILSNIAQRAKESAKVRVKSYSEYARLTKERSSYGSGTDILNKVSEHFKTSRATTFFYISLRNLISPLLDRFSRGEMTRADAAVLCKLPVKLQQYIVDNGYITEMNRWQIQALKKADTTDDIDKIVIDGVPEEHKTHTYKLTLPITRPKDSSLLGFCVLDKDSDLVRNTIIDALKTLPLSPESKELLKKQGYLSGI